MIFFSATDVGGARAIIPVLDELQKRAVPFCIMDEGVLSTESNSSYRRISLSTLETEESFKLFLQRECIDLVCVGTAVKKRLPIYHSVWASDLNVPSVAILDNWMNYRQRFVLSNKEVVFPDYYFVMDQLAFDDARREGIPASILKITGHPGLASLAVEAKAYYQKNSTREVVSSLRFVFISEPAAADHGTHASVKTYRGYTEFDVLKLISDFFAHQKIGCELIIAPHPREDRTALQLFCSEVFPPSIRWSLSNYTRGRDAIFEADGVIGMTSILLYEAWLLGLPVMSLQPNLRGGGASHFLERKGCCCVTKEERIQAALDQWIDRVMQKTQGTGCFQSDLLLHRSAPKLISQYLVEISS